MRIRPNTFAFCALHNAMARLRQNVGRLERNIYLKQNVKTPQKSTLSSCSVGVLTTLPVLCNLLQLPKASPQSPHVATPSSEIQLMVDGNCFRPHSSHTPRLPICSTCAVVAQKPLKYPRALARFTDPAPPSHASFSLKAPSRVASHEQRFYTFSPVPPNTHYTYYTTYCAHREAPEWGVLRKNKKVKHSAKTCVAR